MKNKRLKAIILLSIMLIILTGCSNKSNTDNLVENEETNVSKEYNNLLSKEEIKNEEEYSDFILREVESESFNSDYTVVDEYSEVSREWFTLKKENNNLIITIMESNTNKDLLKFEGNDNVVKCNEKYIIKNVDLDDIEKIFCGVEGQDIYYPSVFILQKDGTVKGIDTRDGYKTGEFIAKSVYGLKQVEKIEQVEVTLDNDSGYVGTMATTKDGTRYEIRKGETFTAIIEKITEYNGITTLLVDGLDDNNINYRDEFTFSINNDIELLWKTNKIEVSDFEVGQKISITFSGVVMESYPGVLVEVNRVIILDKEK